MGLSVLASLAVAISSGCAHEAAQANQAASPAKAGDDDPGSADEPPIVTSDPNAASLSRAPASPNAARAVADDTPPAAPVPASSGQAAQAPLAKLITVTTLPTPGRDGRLSLADARLYMVGLINRDRATAGLRPVVFDPNAPTTSAQAHADDMAKNGYLGHWGTDGSVPESRLTAAGGGDMDLENALCFTDENVRPLDPAARFDVHELDKAEAMFFHEVPPNDGHRKNILRPWHTQVGIGISQPMSTASETAVPCLVQELTDAYGTYAPLPTRATPGSNVHVEGSIHAPALFAGIGIGRTDLPTAVSVHELNSRRSYPVPAPHTMYWPHGFRTPKEVKVTNGHFTIDVPLLDAAGKPTPGLYEVSIWAKLPETHDLQFVGLRTIVVAP